MAIDETFKRIGERLRVIRKNQGHTQKEMAVRYRLGYRALQQYETGMSAPGVDFLTLLSFEGYNLSWLFTGKGDMVQFKRSAHDWYFFLFRLRAMSMFANYSSYKEWFRIDLETRFPELGEWRRQEIYNSAQ